MQHVAKRPQQQTMFTKSCGTDMTFYLLDFCHITNCICFVRALGFMWVHVTVFFLSSALTVIWSAQSVTHTSLLCASHQHLQRFMHFFSPTSLNSATNTHTHTSSHFLFLSVSFWHKDKVTVASMHCSEATASCGELHATLSNAHYVQYASLAIATEKLQWSSKEVICPAQGHHNQDKQLKDATALLAQ